MAAAAKCGPAALGRPRGGRATAAGFVAAGRLAAERRGGSASIPEGRLQARDSRACSGGGGGLLWGLSHPEHVAALDEFLRHLEDPWVDQVTDVAQQFPEEEGGLCIICPEGLVLPHMG